MAGKHETQAMPDDVAGKERPDGTGVPADARGAGGGGPTGPNTKGKFRGGQSEPAYHGTGQLGEEPVEGQDNPNAPDG